MHWGLQKPHRDYTHGSSAWKKSSFSLMNLLWAISSTLYVPYVPFLRHCGNTNNIFCIDPKIAGDIAAPSWGPWWQVEAGCQVHQLHLAAPIWACATARCHSDHSWTGESLLHSRSEQSFLESVGQTTVAGNFPELSSTVAESWEGRIPAQAAAWVRAWWLHSSPWKTLTSGSFSWQRSLVTLQYEVGYACIEACPTCQTQPILGG